MSRCEDTLLGKVFDSLLLWWVDDSLGLQYEPREGSNTGSLASHKCRKGGGVSVSGPSLKEKPFQPPL